MGGEGRQTCEQFEQWKVVALDGSANEAVAHVDVVSVDEPLAVAHPNTAGHGGLRALKHLPRRRPPNAAHQLLGVAVVVDEEADGRWMSVKEGLEEGELAGVQGLHQKEGRVVVEAKGEVLLRPLEQVEEALRDSREPNTEK